MKIINIALIGAGDIANLHAESIQNLEGAELVGLWNRTLEKGKKKADKQTVAWRYELEAEGTGVQGTYQIKVWSYSRNVETATEQSKKNAVHGIIFKGINSKSRDCKLKTCIKHS